MDRNEFEKCDYFSVFGASDLEFGDVNEYVSSVIFEYVRDATNAEKLRAVCPITMSGWNHVRSLSDKRVKDLAEEMHDLLKDAYLDDVGVYGAEDTIEFERAIRETIKEWPLYNCEKVGQRDYSFEEVVFMMRVEADGFTERLGLGCGGPKEACGLTGCTECGTRRGTDEQEI